MLAFIMSWKAVNNCREGGNPSKVSRERVAGLTSPDKRPRFTMELLMDTRNENYLHDSPFFLNVAIIFH